MILTGDSEPHHFDELKKENARLKKEIKDLRTERAYLLDKGLLQDNRRQKHTRKTLWGNREKKYHIDISERKKHEEAISQYSEGLNFLSGTAIELLGAKKRPELLRYITDQLYKVSGGALIVFSEFDVIVHKVIVKELRCNQKERDKIMELLGREPEGLMFDFPEDARGRMIQGGLDLLEGGFSDLVFGQFPTSLCAEFEKELNLGSIFAMACTVEEDILGTVSVLTHEHTTVPKNKILIESVVNQTALVLKRKRSEEALFESEEKFAAAFRSNPNALVLSYHENGTIIDVNDSFLDLFGRSKEEVSGKTALSLNLFSNPKDLRKTIYMLKKCGRIANYELKIRKKSGEERVALLSSELLHMRQNVATLSTFQDITDRKKSEEALKKSEERYRQLVESASSIIIRWDKNGKLRFVNEYGLRFFGYTSTEMIGKNVMMIVPEKELSGRDLSHLIEDIIANPRKYVQFENENLRKNGDHVWVNWSNRAIFDEKGDLLEILAIGNDITERKKAEEKLLTSEAAMEAFFDSSPGILNLIDDNFCFINMDRTTPKYFGLTRETMKGMCIKNLSPLLLEYYGDLINHVLQTGEPYLNIEIQNEVPSRPGERSYWSTSFFRVPLPGGKWGIGLVGIDITDVKRSERALAHEQELFEGIFNNIPVMITMYDPGQKHFRFNKEYINILGWTEEDAKDGNLMAKVYPDPAYRRKVSEYMKQMEPGWQEWSTTAKDGTLVDSSWANILLPSGVQIGIGIDIRKNRQAEEKLRQSEERFRLLFENITEGVAIHELVYENNNPVNYRIIDINPAYKEYTGLNTENAKGSLATDLYETNQAPYLKEYSKVAITRQPHRFETFSPQMNKHFIINVISPKKGQFATVFEDITEQKRIEQEMKMRNEELTRFIYTVSHDLKSPLVTIKMFSHYLRDDINNNDKSAQEKDLGYIENAADKMGRLLDELLELSRIGRKEDPKTDVLLTTIVQSTIDLLAGPIREKNVKIIITAPPVLLHGYYQRLFQLYQNLVDNAVKFSGNQPDPIVEIGAFIDENNEIILFVKDNGIGIEKQYHNKLFGLFEKLDPRSEGSGIGLALVKRIVEVHGGRVWFTSEGVNKGTTFYFTLEKTKVLNQKT